MSAADLKLPLLASISSMLSVLHTPTHRIPPTLILILILTHQTPLSLMFPGILLSREKVLQTLVFCAHTMVRSILPSLWLLSTEAPHTFVSNPLQRILSCSPPCHCKSAYFQVTVQQAVPLHTFKQQFNAVIPLQTFKQQCSKQYRRILSSPYLLLCCT